MKFYICFKAMIFRTTKLCHTDRFAFNTGSVLGNMCLYIYLLVILNVVGTVTFNEYKRTFDFNKPIGQFVRITYEQITGI